MPTRKNFPNRIEKRRKGALERLKSTKVTEENKDRVQKDIENLSKKLNLL
jgi:hypothetical protein